MVSWINRRDRGFLEPRHGDRLCGEPECLSPPTCALLHLPLETFQVTLHHQQSKQPNNARRRNDSGLVVVRASLPPLGYWAERAKTRRCPRRRFDRSRCLAFHQFHQPNIAALDVGAPKFLLGTANLLGLPGCILEFACCILHHFSKQHQFVTNLAVAFDHCFPQFVLVILR